MIKARQLIPGDDVVFQRITPSGDHQVIAVTRLFRFCQQTRMVPVPLGIVESKAREIVRLGRIDRAKIVSLQPNAMKIPLLVIRDRNGNDDLIDGNHRYVKAAIMKFPVLDAYLCTPVIWAQYIVTGLPKLTEEELMKAPRHLAVGRR